MAIRTGGDAGFTVGRSISAQDRVRTGAGCTAAPEDDDTAGAPVAAVVVQVCRLPTLKLALGIEAVTALLDEFARRIRAWAPAPGVVSVLPDGRYLVILPGVSASGAFARCAHLTRQLAVPVATPNGRAARTVRIGIAGDRVDETAAGVADLVVRATTALGGDGPPAVRLWDEDAAARERLAARLELDLQGALRSRSGLVLHFQPEVDLRNGRLLAVEALARWQHPALGMLGADCIIPVAEASGDIVALGRWALDRAFEERARWALEHPDRDVVLRVNVSPTQLQADPDLPGYVGGLLDQHRLAGRQVGIELTEEMRALESPRAVSVLASLRRLGVQIAIDDFGVAYSSPARLDDFPFDTVKIDGRFVHGPGGETRASETTRYAVSTLVHLAERLGMAVVAEGIETAEDVAQMVRLGCLRGQGNGLLSAVDATRMAAVVAAGGIRMP